jgi:Zn-dependent protease with chaperone function
MDFFEHQDQARRQTGRLIALFIVAVLALLVGLNAVVGAVMASQGEVHPLAFVFVTLGALSLITLGSLYRISSLRGGGRKVAEMLGGRRLQPGRVEGKERQLLNVVEEMAIASGAPMPAVYVMDDEAGINAFAAGFHPGDAVVGVTRGTLEQLSRDELQGVVAHEFSHILHGDMRLNVRLMGVLFGILLLGLIGQMILRSLRFAGGGRNKNGGQAVLVILAIGAALFILGYAGTFFGNLIKAAASRQREFLADASAVQYTRNPGGIAGALLKIAGASRGSLMANPSAPEASHMFFGAGVKSRLGRLSATHPPLEERVTRLLPQLAGRVKRAFAGDRGTVGVLHGEVAGLASLAAAAPDARPAAAKRASALAQVGQVSEAHMEHARELLQALPENLRRAAAEPFSARAVIYALLVDADDVVRSKQLVALERHADPEVWREFQRIEPAVRALATEERLPVVELAIPALTELTGEQYARFTQNLEALIQADSRVTFEEFALERTLRHVLDPLHEPRAAKRSALHPRGTLVRSAPEAALVLRRLSEAGADDAVAASHAFEVAWRQLDLGPAPPAGESQATSDLSRALDVLRSLAPLECRQLLRAAVAAIAVDKEVRPAEAQLFRLLGEALDVPIPPILADQALA